MADIPIDFRAWQSIDYRPVIAAQTPESLLPFLAAGQTALDVGCNTGEISFWIARQGVSVTGIDINAAALETARREAVRAGIQSLTNFKLADITCDAVTGPFDVVVLIRVLTCIASTDAWNTVLQRIGALLPVGGLLYVHDFLRDDAIAHYRQRYREADSRGWRSGNIAVNDSQGKLLFVAHHHSQEELEHIAEPYVQLGMTSHLSRSMNGNECRMFRFLGTKR